MIVATAGHVDHGKTSLVRLLTGVDTDRLPEEKRRGLSIDLGFAYRRIDGGPTIGFVDVPGHERFIHNMLSGIACIDFVLLVVAADDGPMPQTLEHLAIVDLLEIRRGAVALTKTDRVPDERIGNMMAELAAMLGPTLLAGAPVFPCSTLTGAGIDAIERHLEREARALQARSAEGNFRLSVDRCFNVKGAGLVVTGTAVSGAVGIGDAVRALIAGVNARVRSIHAQNEAVQSGRAGQRCAINLAGAALGKLRIRRGEWIVTGSPAPATCRADAWMRVLASEARALIDATSVHVHIGAADVTGRIAVLEGPSIVPGHGGLVQLVLDEPVGAVHGDGFVVRDQSSRRTIGGGRIVDAFAPSRGRARKERLARIAAIALPDHEQALRALLERTPEGLNLEQFAANRNLRTDEIERLLQRVPAKSVPSATGRLVYDLENWASLRDRVLSALSEWHRRRPERVGPAADRILHGTDVRMTREAVVAVAAELAHEGAVVRESTGVRLPGHLPRLLPADAALWERIAPLLEKSVLRPPTVAELAVVLGREPSAVEAALTRLEDFGLLVRVSGNRFFPPSMLRQLAEIAAEQARAEGAITAAGFRDRSKVGRNLAIDLLEFFDRTRFTRRVGDAHVLVRRPGGDRARDPGQTVQPPVWWPAPVAAPDA